MLDLFTGCKSAREVLESVHSRNAMEELTPVVQMHATIYPELEFSFKELSVEDRFAHLL
jgi:hypothetical protein